MKDKGTMFTNNASTSKEEAPFMQSDYYLYSKMHFTGENTNTLGWTPVDKTHEQPMIGPTYPRKEFISYKLKEMKVPIPTIVDMVEKLKKSLTHVFLWDLLSFHEQKN